VLKHEARWIGDRLRSIDAERLSPLLSVGSAGAEFREVTQPWIDGSIYGPLRARGVSVVHHELEPQPGIDLVGDLNAPAFLELLAARAFRAILCCNVLEHVPDPARLATALAGLLPPGGLVVVSVPYRFPYHPDPIDTMFRPTVDEVARQFGACRVIDGAILDGGTGWEYIGGDLRTLVSRTMRRLTERRRTAGLMGTGSFAPWLFRTFQVTCVVLEKVETRDVA
jgi:SAM-dependent methyltransferase